MESVNKVEIKNKTNLLLKKIKHNEVPLVYLNREGTKFSGTTKNNVRMNNKEVGLVLFKFSVNLWSSRSKIFGKPININLATTVIYSEYDMIWYRQS